MSYIDYVRCNCFKEGLSKPFKYIKYVKLVGNYFELELPDEIKQDEALADKIYDEFYDWRDFPCEHEDGEYYSCQLGGKIQYYIYLMKAETDFSALLSLSPDFNNDGFIPTSYNAQLRAEIEELMKREITCYNFVSKEPIGWGMYFQHYEIAENVDELLCEKGDEKLYSCNDVFRIEKNGEVIFRSSNFTVERIINRRFIFTDHDKRAESTVFFNLNLFRKGNKQRLYYEKNTYSMKNELKYEYENLINLLNASDVTGNPICWD